MLMERMVTSSYPGSEKERKDQGEYTICNQILKTTYSFLLCLHSKFPSGSYNLSNQEPICKRISQ